MALHARQERNPFLATQAGQCVGRWRKTPEVSLTTPTQRRSVQPPKEEVAAAARICRETGCTTVLSQYNATAWCGLHSRRDWRATREPRRRSAPIAGPPDEGADEW